MTKRKPPNVSFPDWIERQIKTAEAEGAFDNLPGAGKPIPGLNRPRDEMSWVADYLRRENVDAAALLPPALALAKEVEDLPLRLSRAHSERQVREIVDDLNQRILRAHRMPQLGPPVRVRTVDVDAAISEWAAVRAAAKEARRAAAQQQPTPTRRRWFTRRR